MVFLGNTSSYHPTNLWVVWLCVVRKHPRVGSQHQPAVQDRHAGVVHLGHAHEVDI